MADSFHERFAREEVPLPSDRSTGLVFTAAALVAAYVWRRSELVPYVALSVAGVFAVISILAPTLLRPLNIMWMKLALLLNMIMSPIIMGVLFFGVIVPFGLVMRLRHDPLRKRRDGEAATYWIDKAGPPSSMTNQF